METLRKGFYVLDLLVLALLMVCINHTMAYETEWGFLALDVALLLRFNSTFLLYRRERVWVSFRLLYSLFCMATWCCLAFFKTPYLGWQNTQVLS